MRRNFIGEPVNRDFIVECSMRRPSMVDSYRQHDIRLKGRRAIMWANNGNTMRAEITRN